MTRAAMNSFASRSRGWCALLIPAVLLFSSLAYGQREVGRAAAHYALDCPLFATRHELAAAIGTVPPPGNHGPHTIRSTAPARPPPSGKARLPVASNAASRAPYRPVLSQQHVDGSAQPASSSQRTVGLFVGGIGAATLVTGSMLAWSARARWIDAKARCPDNQCQTQLDADQARDARSRAIVATAVISGGALGAVGGALLWILAPSTVQQPGSADLRIAPAIGLHSVGIQVRGGF